ncbi:siderophore-interacting protein [Verrucosispora sp. WMMD573]|uniref:siderophore-interacting protein n=1 Tax=Verrucosispora sp. WMMD573 TaxID=3015149 RepID=UPI00248ACD0A|nr:siderophore-interacting protein [Verrucosispora sp. WMMD573]WBB53805.1 siderophore-interacting protein [Verrucosispora sp. WMMD573]
MARHSRPVRPARQEFLRAEVLRSQRVSPTFQRVTIGGEDLRRFAPMGFDQWFRLFLPGPGQHEITLPGRTDLLGYARYRAMPPRIRPVMRNYSVRAFRPEVAELDIDFVRHQGGYACSWADKAQPGEPVAILDQGIGYSAPAHVAWTLLAADETGLPAIAGILASLPAATRGLVLLEVPDRSDIAPLLAPEGMEVRWHFRTPDEAAGRPTLTTVRLAELPDQAGYAFVVGEAAMVASVRRHLVHDRAMPKADVAFCGYWRHPTT